MMTFLAPLAIWRPLPLITPLLPMPMMDLFDPTLIGLGPALSYVTLMEVTLSPAFPLVHLAICKQKKA
jgi:hypothetical protein